MNAVLRYVFYVCCFSILTAQGQQFKVIDISNGLANNTVNAIEQDTRGFMWFGTSDGLCMYDGVNFITYRNQAKDTFSLTNNFVTSISAVKEGIWVGTRGGLCFFSYNDQRFHRVSMISNGERRRITGFVRNIVLTDKSVAVLTDTEGLLTKLHTANIFGQTEIPEELNDWLMIAAYKRDEILAHGSNGLFIIDLSTKRIQAGLRYQLHQPVDHLYYSAAMDKIIVGSGFERKTGLFSIHNDLLVQENGYLPAGVKAVLDYSFGNNNEIVFGTDGYGIVKQTGSTISSINHANSNLSSDAVYALFKDDENNLWVGTSRGGINLYSNRNNWFHSVTTKNSTLRHAFVTAIYESPSRKLYIGTDGGGLNVYDPKSGRSQVYQRSNSTLSGNNVLSIVGDAKGVWLGIYGGGVSRMRYDNHQFINYSLPGSYGQKNDSKNHVWVLKQEGDDFLWIGAESGVYRLNKHTGAYDIIQTNIRNVSEIAFAKDAVWVSTNGSGLYKLDYEGRIKQVINANSQELMVNNNLHYVYVDSSGLIWFGLEHGGLYQLDPHSAKLKVYGKESGFANPNVVGIVEDSLHNLWISTYNGLFRFTKSNETFIRFSENDFFSSAQFNYNACFKSSTGMLYFGTAKGYIYFNPTDIRFSALSKPLLFTDFTLLNNTQGTRFAIDSTSPKVNVAHNQNFFTISFSVPELVSPDKIRYSYILEGFDNAWSEPGSKRQITYTNVPPGSYSFKVRSTNIQGDWIEQDSVLKIVIDPPWWNTWWAITAFAILGIAVITTVFVIHRHDLKMKHMVELKEIEKNTEKSINEAKLTFFTNISHELRTPIFLLTAPLEELISSKAKQIVVARSALVSMFRNANRLHKLINRIIDFRKLESGKLTLQLQYTNVVSFCRELCADYEALLAQKKILLLFMPEKAEINLSFDPDKLESVITNLIVNAFKYTPEEGKVILSITEKQDQVWFVVEDNGIGIDKESYGSIFEQFYQVKSKGNVAAGDGIGLSFVRNLVELHGGSVSVESEVDRGSIFSFSIPKRSGEQISETPPVPAVAQVPTLPQLPKASTVSNENPAAAVTILIIDDELEIQDLIEQVLSAEYKVIKASNGADALKIVRNAAPDLIICDIMMPVMNGIDFVNELRNDKVYSNIPVIMLTAKTSEDDMVKLFGIGADAFLSKPVSTKFLRQRISQLLKQAEATDSVAFISDTSVSYSKTEKRFIHTCKTILDANYDNPDFDVASFAQQLGMSHSTLYKKIKSLTGKSVIGFINAYRVYKAVQLMRDGERSISEVGMRCGFNDLKNFREVFKHRMGMTPSEYINNE